MDSVPVVKPIDSLYFTQTDVLAGRSSSGAGLGEEITCAAFARTLLDDADAETARTTLGLAAIAASGAWSDLSGTPTTLAGYGISDAASDAELAAHTGNANNPHSVTAAQVGLGNVENTALSTWAGSSNLTTLGTITTGAWTGTAIAVANGGTGATTAPDARTNLGLGTNAAVTFARGTITGSHSSAFVVEDASGNDALVVNTSFKRVGIGGAPSVALDIFVSTVATSTVANNFRYTQTSTGTVANGFGIGQRYDLQAADGTTVANVGSITIDWEDATSKKARLRLASSGPTEITIGGSGGNYGFSATSWGTNANRVIALGNGTAPSTYPHVQLWADTGELKVADTTGNVTTLSPHSDQGPPELYDEAPGVEWVVPHVQAFVGEVRWYNVTRAFRQSGIPAANRKPALIVETFAEYNTRRGLTATDPDYLTPLDWDAHEAWLIQEQARQRAEWQAAKAEHQAEQERLTQEAKAAHDAWLRRIVEGDPDPGPEPKPYLPDAFERAEPQPHAKRQRPAWAKGGRKE